jgi:hypothetical protein
VTLCIEIRRIYFTGNNLIILFISLTSQHGTPNVKTHNRTMQKAKKMRNSDPHQKTGSEPGCSWRVSSSCSTSGTRRVNLVTNPVISREWGKDWEVFTTSGTYPWSFVIMYILMPPSVFFYVYWSNIRIYWIQNHLFLTFLMQDMLISKLLHQSPALNKETLPW